MPEHYDYGVPRPVPTSSVDPGLFSAVFGGMSILLLCYAAFIFYNGWQSYNWLPTQGTVISSKVARVYSNKRYRRKEELLYRYRVANNSFDGVEIKAPSNDSWNTWDGLSYRVLNKFRANENVTVFYDPNEPGRACLEPGIDYGVCALLTIVGILFGSVPFTGPLREKFFPTQPALITKVKDGHVILTSAFRKEQEKETDKGRD